ncbi:RraA family protein [Streptomyces winkii]|uniref:RraA family protein n=1 Tax=Streptomyces winkii TaxID=3051178 RepID=UPI0028D874FB|nr:RraA family protein [Streptomyces sp. DSM 40971]
MSSENDVDLAARAARLGSANLVDAMGRVHGHRAHVLALASPDPARPLFGPAVTLAYLPYRDDLPQSTEGFTELFYEAIGPSPSGHVLVLSSGGYPDASHGGGTKLSRVAHHGLAGVLADGRLRDFGELRDHGFATWCRGEATRWGGDTVMPYAAGVAVEVAGVCVIPGDYVFADAAGAVVIPKASLDRVLRVAAEIEAEDAESASRIREERLPR